MLRNRLVAYDQTFAAGFFQERRRATRDGKDLRSAHFERCTFEEGTDFTGCDLRDASFYDCSARRAILPDHDEPYERAAVDYLDTSGTDWTDAVFPSNLIGCQFEFSAEVWRQAVPRLQGRTTRAEMALVVKIRDYALNNKDIFTFGWVVGNLMDEGHTKEEIARAQDLVYENLPRMNRISQLMLRAFLHSPSNRLARRTGVVASATTVDVRANLTRQLELVDVSNPATRDRYLLARDVEARAASRDGARVRIYIPELKPLRIITALSSSEESEERWDWWWREY